MSNVPDSPSFISSRADLVAFVSAQVDHRGAEAVFLAPGGARDDWDLLPDLVDDLESAIHSTEKPYLRCRTGNAKTGASAPRVARWIAPEPAQHLHLAPTTTGGDLEIARLREDGATLRLIQRQLPELVKLPMEVAKRATGLDAYYVGREMKLRTWYEEQLATAYARSERLWGALTTLQDRFLEAGFSGTTAAISTISEQWLPLAAELTKSFAASRRAQRPRPCAFASPEEAAQTLGEAFADLNEAERTALLGGITLFLKGFSNA